MSVTNEKLTMQSNRIDEMLVAVSSPIADIGLQKLSFWLGVAGFVMFWLGVWPLPAFIPPPDPNLTGAELMARFQERGALTKLGMVVGMTGAVLLTSWTVALSLQVARIETRGIPVMAVSCFGFGIVNSVAFFIPFLFWAPALYRPERTGELVLLMNDAAWLEFFMMAAPFALQTITVAVAGLRFDGRFHSPFPRWFCFFSLWMATGVTPAVMVIFFFSGPFAWNGLFACWLPIASFCTYYVIAFPLVYRSIAAQGRTERPVPVVESHA